ncbi:hypothetical protein EET67_09135 [Pseudaminobacter arsenicus]|uniref:Uncharacterized protein n=1 Tax=Borborobacter arsenicus TaxID=1851146 RepID=A0A432V7U8_9HYPH|nr:hypothetical protein [Pseudaminobacter arsenicus]RUM98252.1 hypothetical protein EET67_09135 [Pseudaminobacter arsenicus]
MRDHQFGRLDQRIESVDVELLPREHFIHNEQLRRLQFTLQLQKPFLVARLPIVSFYNMHFIGWQTRGACDNVIRMMHVGASSGVGKVTRFQFAGVTIARIEEGFEPANVFLGIGPAIYGARFFIHG